MTELPSVEELNSQVELRKSRLTQVIADIRNVLQTDIEAFVRRETKRAFLAQPAISAALDRDKIAALKSGMSALAESESSRISNALGNSELWTTLEPHPENTRELAGATAVWTAVTSVEGQLTSFLSGFGLTDEHVAYKAPAYFVDGRYLPSLAEHFWRLVHEIDELHGQSAQLKADVVRSDLEAKWEDA
ncbi:MAG: hypothetical protein ACI9MR_002448 [Myxococcota bacterium]